MRLLLMHDSVQASTVLYNIIQELLLCTTLLHCMDHGPILITDTTLFPVPQPPSQAVGTFIQHLVAVMQMIMLEYGA